ncbi:hypothetical protein CON71_17600 [Bacillus thuringiensis]|uniref:SH3b domain-containing protein n=1 Tax=Bacillus thuringiensis TaxID=1428 RepID=A0A9X6Y9R6_BACTU|nr:hypothetical protein CON71_17600 [Bacillus thuringiensis]
MTSVILIEKQFKKDIILVVVGYYELLIFMSNKYFNTYNHGKVLTIMKKILASVIVASVTSSTVISTVQAQTSIKPKNTTHQQSFNVVKAEKQVRDNHYIVNADLLRVRMGPSTSNAILGFVTKEQPLQVITKTNGWYKIRYKDRIGFVSGEFVKRMKNPAELAQQKHNGFIKPAAGRYTSGFGNRGGHMHYGLDIAAPGKVPIIAAADGVVTRSYYSESYGNVVFISHNVKGKMYTTVYAHLNSRSVSTNQSVTQGQEIGFMGNTGHSHGQHLHFEIHKGNWNYQKTNAVDPSLYI